MNTRRLNITLPKELASLLRDKPNKSAYIAEALKEKFSAEDKKRRDQQLGEAYREAAQAEMGLLSDWDAASGDGL